MNARVVFVLLAVSSSAMAADPVADISHCAAMTDPDARLACYDAVGSRYAVKKGAPAAAVAAVPSAPAAQPQPLAAQPAAPAEQRAQFGLQPNQLPQDPEAPKKLTAIEGVVSGFGHAPNGHQVVRVDNAQSWELLQDSDPLLVPGDEVSIRRALLGSYIMTTPSGREHRVKRLTQ